MLGISCQQSSGKSSLPSTVCLNSSLKSVQNPDISIFSSSLPLHLFFLHLHVHWGWFSSPLSSHGDTLYYFIQLTPEFLCLFSFSWLLNAARVLWWHRPLVNLAQDALVRHWTTIIYPQKCLSAPWHSFSVSEVLLEITSKFEMFHHIITVITWKNFILISSYTSF